MRLQRASRGPEDEQIRMAVTGTGTCTGAAPDQSLFMSSESAVLFQWHACGACEPSWSLLERLSEAEGAGSSV